MKNNYTEKEINIFSGVLRLAADGADISKITARQIAASAGVGKATIYDYFSSKEEIVKGALLYSMSQEAGRFAAAMAATSDFKEKMEIIYQGVISKVENTGSIFYILLNMGHSSRHRDSCPGIDPDIHRIIMEFVQILADVLACGHRQGVLKTDILAPANADYVRMVLLANIFATANRAADKTHPQPHQAIIANSYTMLIKALG